jgi:hypothetical protein
MSSKRSWGSILVLVLGLAYLSIQAEEEDRAVSSTPSAALVHVNENYQRSVRPIFAQKCFDCHSHLGTRPWYASIPGPKQLIDKDIREATADMDMSQDFPFLGKGTPLDYLDVLEDAVKDGSMPPWRYRILHWDSKLTDLERTRILEWIESSRKELHSNTGE